MSQPIRVLVAKPGLDGHDRGALVVAAGLRDEGMEVIYTGLRQSPEQIVATAIQEDVACIGLSSLSGAHLALFPEVVRLLREEHADDILVIGGGVIPEEDIDKLKSEGVAAVFTSGATISEMANYIRSHVHLRDLEASVPPQELAKQLDHVGIAVHSIADALPFYETQLGLHLIETEEVDSQKVRAAFLGIGDAFIELLEPLCDESPVAKFLAKRGPGLHHVAYVVDDVELALKSCARAGCRLIDEHRRLGSRNYWVGFVHPKSAEGVLTEFCQKRAEEDKG